MDIYIIGRCGSVSKEEKKKRKSYLFKINGYLTGKYIKVAHLGSQNNLSINDDYLLCVKIKEVKQEVLFGDIITAKKISSMRRDIL